MRKPEKTGLSRGIKKERKNKSDTLCNIKVPETIQKYHREPTTIMNKGAIIYYCNKPLSITKKKKKPK